MSDLFVEVGFATINSSSRCGLVPARAQLLLSAQVVRPFAPIDEGSVFVQWLIDPKGSYVGRHYDPGTGRWEHPFPPDPCGSRRGGVKLLWSLSATSG